MFSEKKVYQTPFILVKNAYDDAILNSYQLGDGEKAKDDLGNW